MSLTPAQLEEALIAHMYHALDDDEYTTMRVPGAERAVRQSQRHSLRPRRLSPRPRHHHRRMRPASLTPTLRAGLWLLSSRSFARWAPTLRQRLKRRLILARYSA